MHLRTMTIVLTTTISSTVAGTEIIMNAFCILSTLKYFIMYKERIQFVFFSIEVLFSLVTIAYYEKGPIHAFHMSWNFIWLQKTRMYRKTKAKMGNFKWKKGRFLF